MLERKILIAAIVSTEFLHQIENIWNNKFFALPASRRIATWVWQYYKKYNQAPGRAIEQIFYEKIKTERIPEDIAEEIEQDILPSLSEEYEAEGVNVTYLVDETIKYFNERSLTLHTEKILALLKKGDITDADAEACNYKPLQTSTAMDLNMSDPVVLERVEKAFTTEVEPLIEYSFALGSLWNDQLVRGAFVALLAPEKRGKTWMLLELAMRACKQKRSVAFFQAGDMNEAQLLRRICIMTSSKSNLKRYCAETYEPEMDCVRNQCDTCNKEERECHFGPFKGKTPEQVRGKITYKELVEAYKSNPDYKPCRACDDYKTKPIGSPWLRHVPETTPLTADEAKAAINDFFVRYKRQFRLSTHPNDTLSISQINAILDVWEKRDGFVPDVIVIDYADLLVAEGYRDDFRQQQNKVWKGLRSLSQTRGNPLVITATQADAASYEKNSLRMKNFSEDKRKLAHVTGTYGLNQDVDDREKMIGLMRINVIVQREGEFYHSNEVTILQNIKRGKPHIGSYL